MHMTTLTLDAVERGCFAENGEHVSDHQNTAAGIAGARGALHTFFIFHLPHITGTISRAMLRLELEAYFSMAKSESFAVFGVSTPVQEVVLASPAGAAAGQTIFQDLGSGQVYGRARVTADDAGCIIEIGLWPQAIAALLAAAGERFAIGIGLDQSLNLSPGPDHLKVIRFSADSEPRTHQLVLETEPLPVPLPRTDAFGLQYDLPEETVSATLCEVVAAQATMLEGMLRNLLDAIRTVQGSQDLSAVGKTIQYQTLVRQTSQQLAELSQRHVFAEQRIGQIQTDSGASLAEEDAAVLQSLERINSVLHANLALVRRHLDVMLEA